ncbi:Kinesin-like protein KIN-UC [Linum perenne]
MRVGEANRHAANTKQNTESSRSHAILVVSLEPCLNGLPRVRKSKMLIVDLAGSERIDKSGT